MILSKFFNRRPRSNNYFICTVQRSGKSWLCNLLSKLHGYGAPEEYLIQTSLEKKFGAPELKRIITEKNNWELRDYIQEITYKKSSSCEVLGLAIQESQIKNLSKIAELPPLYIFNNLFRMFNNPKVFFLKRRDFAAQAVSHYFMAQTGIAHSYQVESDKEPYKNIRYDQQEIGEWYTFTRKAYDFWESIFSQAGVKFDYIYYEDLVEDLYGTISELTRKINNEMVVTQSQLENLKASVPEKMASQKKIEYVERFKKHLEKSE